MLLLKNWPDWHHWSVNCSLFKKHIFRHYFKETGLWLQCLFKYSNYFCNSSYNKFHVQHTSCFTFLSLTLSQLFPFKFDYSFLKHDAYINISIYTGWSDQSKNSEVFFFFYQTVREKKNWNGRLNAMQCK